MYQPKRAEIASVVATFIEANRAEGYHPLSEASLVLKSAAEFGGWKYRITRELAAGWVDCSTLVSQAHWNGAGVGVPFVAETQRQAYSALAIEPDDRAPSDVLVTYPDKGMSPDGRHNHVVMYLGRHPTLGEWVIESAAAADGVQVRPFRDADLQGGIRRFLPFPKRFAFQEDALALRLARSVPKLGRLGARLTSSLVAPRRHRGVDIYAKEAFAVLSPLDGTVIREPFRGRPHMGALHITSPDKKLGVSLRGIEWLSGGPAVTEAGDEVGICRQHPTALCNSLPGLRTYPRLHLELWSRSDAPFSWERGLEPPEWMGAHPPTPRLFNPIYAIKLGLIGPPIRRDDMNALLAIPWSPS